METRTLFQRWKTRLCHNWGWVVAAASNIYFIAVFGVAYSYGLFFIEFQKEFNSGASVTGWVGAIPVACSILLAPPTKLLLAYFTHRMTVVIGLLLMTTGLIVSSFMPGIFPMFASYGLLYGVGVGISNLASIDLIISYFPSRNCVRAISLAVSGTGIGMLSFAPLINHLHVTLGWRTSFQILGAIVFAVGMPCTLIFVQPSRTVREPQEDPDVKTEGPDVQTKYPDGKSKYPAERLISMEYPNDSTTNSNAKKECRYEKMNSIAKKSTMAYERGNENVKVNMYYEELNYVDEDSEGDLSENDYNLDGKPQINHPRGKSLECCYQKLQNLDENVDGNTGNTSKGGKQETGEDQHDGGFSKSSEMLADFTAETSSIVSDKAHSCSIDSNRNTTSIETDVTKSQGPEENCNVKSSTINHNKNTNNSTSRANGDNKDIGGQLLIENNSDSGTIKCDVSDNNPPKSLDQPYIKNETAEKVSKEEQKILSRSDPELPERLSLVKYDFTRSRRLERIGEARHVLLCPELWMLAVSVLFNGMGDCFYYINLVSFMVSVGFTESDGARVISTMGISILVGKLALSFLGEYVPFPSIFLLIIATTLDCIIITALFFVRDMITMIILAAIIGTVILSVRSVVTYAFPVQFFGPARAKKAWPVILFSNGIGYLVGSIVGQSLDRTGSYDIAIWIFIGLFATSCILTISAPLYQRFFANDRFVVMDLFRESRKKGRIKNKKEEKEKEEKKMKGNKTQKRVVCLNGSSKKDEIVLNDIESWEGFSDLYQTVV